MSITMLKDGGGNNLSSGTVAIHAALVPSPTGAAIVYFGVQGTAWSYDPNTPQTAPKQLTTQPGEWAFCASHAFLQDGRWVITGGVFDNLMNQDVDHHGPHHDSGERRCSMFSPLAGRFDPIRDLCFQPDAAYGGGRWYPTTLSLANGEVLAVAGHPFAGTRSNNPAYEQGQPDPDNPPQFLYDTTGADNYQFPPGDGPRHNNNTPERYSPGQDKWTLMVADSTSHDDHAQDEYPRLHLGPSGHVFFSTIAKNDLRFYDPYTGKYGVGSVQPGDADYHRGSAFSSVVLPVLPGDNDNIWVLACGSIKTQKANIANSQPVWENAGSPPLGKQRVNCSAVLLPTGSVFLTGGELDKQHYPEANSPDPLPTIPPAELYIPPIDWAAGQYTSGTGQWKSIDTPGVGRGYHSVALLQPDGRVWIAGSTWSNWTQNEHRMEVYSPPYIVPGRIEITKAPPSASYGSWFPVELSSNAKISRVVLMRCGSATHSFDADQRCVVCHFSQNGDTLSVMAPEGPGLAPPGHYMLFVLDSTMIDGHGRPCVRAPLLRLCDQECTPVNNRSTFSKLEVDAIKENKKAVFPDAIWLFLENYRPHEAGFPSNPVVSLTWDSPTGQTVDSATFSLIAKNPWMEDATLPPDIAQRFTFRYDVQVHESVYASVNVERDLVVHWTFEHFTCTTQLRLTTKANPFMSDVQGGNPHWLSTDLRVFKVQAGATPPAGAPALGNNEAPLDYLASTLTSFNAGINDNAHPFLKLATDQTESSIELRTTVDKAAVYNFAIAKVRYLAQGQNAEQVRVFFRMFNTVGTMLEFDSEGTYFRHGDGPGAVPLTGHVGPAIISLPFFEQARVTPSASMIDQPPDTARTLVAGGNKETTAYFGAWLDVNQDSVHIPPLWFNNGPYSGALPPTAPDSIKALVRNYHQCLVAEIHFGDDPIPDAATGDGKPPGTPANNDNLSQRNLAWVSVGNPGSAATRSAQTTFMARPSGKMPSSSLMPVTIVPRGQILRTMRTRRHGPDELVFDGSKLPKGSRIIAYMPDVDVNEILALAQRRSSPIRFAPLDEHTLAFEPGPVAFMPLPGGRTSPIAGLLSLELPPGIKAGEQYQLVVHQVSGSKRRVTGSFQVNLPVAHEPELLDDERIKLSILRWIATRIPNGDVWQPIFVRYLGEIADRVRGFGGDPDLIRPSSNGNPNGEGDGESERDAAVRGHVAEVVYDCAGHFIGFVLCHCDQRRHFKCCGSAVERVLLRACDEQQELLVRFDRKNPDRMTGLSLLGECC